MQIVPYHPAWQIVLSKRSAQASLDPAFLGPADPLPPKKLLRRFCHEARSVGASYVYFRLPVGFEALPETRSQIKYLSYASVVEYLADACILAREVKGPGGRALRTVIDVGSLGVADLAGLAEVVDHFRLNLEFPRLPNPHTKHDVELARSAWIHATELRLAELARLGVRLVVGLHVGVGETEQDWTETFALMRAFAALGGHLQAFALRPFMAYPEHRETRGMATCDEVTAVVAAARQVLPKSTEIWMGADGRADLVEELRRGVADGPGMICLNQPLASGLRTDAWYEAELGPLDLFRCRKFALAHAAKGGANGNGHGNGNGHHAGPTYRLSEDGYLTDGVAVWVPRSQGPSAPSDTPIPPTRNAVAVTP